MAIKNNPISIKELSKFLDGTVFDGNVFGTIGRILIPAVGRYGLREA